MAMASRALVGFAWLVLGLAAPIAARAQAVKAGVVTTAEGHVTVRRVVLPQPVPLRFKDDVFLQDTVTTGDRSLARLLLGGKALVTIRERSALTVTELPGRSTVDMDAGKVGMAVARDRMRPGEAIDIRTPNAIVAVRGTVLVVEVRGATAQAGAGSSAPTTDVYLLKDFAEVTPIDPATRAPIGPVVPLSPMQRFTATGTAPPRITTFTAADLPQIADGLQPRSVPHQEAANPEQVKGMLLDTTAALLAAVTGTGPERLALAAETAALSAPPQPVEATPTAPPIIPEIEPALEQSAPAPTPSPSPPPPAPGGEVSITGELTIPAGQTLRTFSGDFVRTDPAPLIQATNARVTQLGPDDLIEVLAGATVRLASPLLDIRNSEIRAGRNLLRVDGLLVGTDPNGLITVDPSTLTSSGDLIRVNPGGVIFTAGPLLSAVDTTITTSPGQLLHVLGGDPDFTTPGVVLTTGTLLSFTRSNLDLTNNLVRLVDGGVLGQSVEETAPPLVVFRDSTYRGGLGPGTVTGGSLLRMFSQRGREGSALVLAGPYLSAVGSTFESREAPLFHIADGSVIVSASAEPFATFERSRVTSASSFFSLDTNTQFGPPPGAPPGTPPTIGSGEPAFITLAGPLIRAVDTNFTVSGAFLRIQNGSQLFGLTESSEPLVSIAGGIHSIAAESGRAMLELSGRPDAVACERIDLPEFDSSVKLDLGTARPVSGLLGPLFEASGAIISTQSVLKLDTALLEATLPILSLKAGTTLTSGVDALDIRHSKVTSVGQFVTLDASTLNVTSGSLMLLNGSFLNVTGDLLFLSNSSKLNLLDGAVLSLTGNSVAQISGAFVAFGGVGNQINITNTACASAGFSCQELPLGTNLVRVASANGSRVSIQGEFIKNSLGGTISYSSKHAAAIVVNGGTVVILGGR